ncbi:MAG: proteasome subunit beta [Candidatus Nanoarchaeia archaeon]|nr:proteasome subunit beta [Candidatus Nanoarchaeia archaeon]MDD5587480.1 proteasome subunit beta [Candidatus Nanoarchaeia archaeon]
MEDKDRQVRKTGTTTVGIVCKDGIILGADKRATLGGGYIFDRKTDKIVFVTEDIAVTTAGNVSDVQLLIKLLRSELKIKEMRMGRRISISEAANLLARMVYQNIRKFSAIPGVAHFIIAGRDDSGIHMHDIFPDGSVSEVKEYVASGSGSTAGALPVLDTLFKENMTLEEGTDLCIKAINSAILRDANSGDGIDVISITEKGIKKVYKKELKMNLK